MVFEKEEKDARDILNRYKKYDDPIKAFREDQRILKVKLFYQILFLFYCN